MQGLSAPPLLDVRGLNVTLIAGGGRHPVLRDIDLTVAPGECVCIVGESGCGKSMTALSLFDLLPAGAIRTASRMRLGDADLCATDAGAASKAQSSTHSNKAYRHLSGRRLSMIFQDPNTAFNPSYTIGEQLEEVWQFHRLGSRNDARARAVELLTKVGLVPAEQRLKQYPHQLSGGQRQRVMIAMALMGSPDLIVADEPTTALDVTVQAQVLTLLRGLQKELGIGLLMITHDFGVVSAIADKVIVMYAGEVIESGATRDVLDRPSHPYTRALLRCLPGQKGAMRVEDRALASTVDRPMIDQTPRLRLATIPGSVPAISDTFIGCRFAPRCALMEAEVCCLGPIPLQNIAGDDAAFADRQVRCNRWRESTPSAALPTNSGATTTYNAAASLTTAAAAPFLQLDNIERTFPVSDGWFRRKHALRALRGVSFSMDRGETLAIVGESGCGKTTLARILLGLQQKTGGTVCFDGLSADRLQQKQRARLAQPVFQDPYASLPPHRRVVDAVAMPLMDLGMRSRRERTRVALDMLERVGLPAHFADRLPSALSGGQRQRVAIARALVPGAPLLICDEPTSALDVSVQAQILNLLADLKEESGLALVLITHNLAVVEHLADRIAVMYLGAIVEQGKAADVLATPRHPYTRLLLNSILRVDAAPDAGGDPASDSQYPNPLHPPSGCAFHPRCARASDRCVTDAPGMSVVVGHEYACHHPEDIDG